MPQEPQIEEPLSSGRQTVAGMPVQLGQGITGTFTGNLSDLPENVKPVDQQSAQPQYKPISVPDAHAARMAMREQSRYASFNSMQKTQKIDALKDLSLNPFLIPDPYDASNNVLQRWKTIGSSKEAQSATPEQRIQAADNFYEKQIYPLYQAMHEKYGAPIPSKENWRENAYTSALKWDIDEAYDSHWRSGFYEGFKDFEQMFKTGLTLLGGTAGSMSLSPTPGYSQIKSDERNLASLIAPVKKQSAYETIEKNAAEVPVIGHVIDSLKQAISKDQFWHDINPNTTWGQKARSFAAEQVMLLPLYRATGGLTSSIIGSLAGDTARVPLTQLLSKTEVGKTALKLLLNGSEGAMYGYTMSDDEDKVSNMAAGAVQQAILGTIFHFGDKKVKLSEAVTTERAGDLAHAAETAEMAKQGWVHGDTDKLAKEVEQSLHGVSLAGGRPVLGDVLNGAFKHVAETEGLNKAEVKAQVKANYAKDPAAWKSIYTTAAYIRSLLGDRKLSTLSSTDRTELMTKLKDVIRNSDALAKAEESEVEQGIKASTETPVGQKVVKDVGPEVYVAANKQAAARAAKETSTRPIDEALDIAKKRGAWVQDERRRSARSDEIWTDAMRQQFPGSGKSPGPATEFLARERNDPGTTKVRTQYRGSGENRSVSVSMEQRWDAYAKKAARADGFGVDTEKWLKDLPPDQFTKDMYDFFYPESLKEAGLDTVESGHVKNMGQENPNLLAFMYNFRDRMPKIFANRLREELINTNKVQQWINPRRLDEPQLVRYAEGMKAHVDELLQTEKFKSENANVTGDVGNVYRSTYESPDKPSPWQMELHQETIDKERGLIEQMFSGKPQQLQEALTAYHVFAGERSEAFLKGNQSVRNKKMGEIDDLLVQLSKGKLQKWEY